MLIALCVLAALAAPNSLVAGPVEKVADGFQFTEGPVWTPTTGLLFSDIPADTIYRTDSRGDKTVFRSPSGHSNGLALDRGGRLIVCEHGTRRVSRTETDGTIAVLADSYLGRKLNSPNDAAIRSDGTIFFTDPPYGVAEGERQLPFCGVYAIKPGGELALLSVYFSHPNGICLSPDEKTLYIADSQDNFIQAYDLRQDGSLANSRLFSRCDNPDGIKADKDGRIWAATASGIMVFRPDGSHAGTIEVPEHPSNCAFGGENGNTLFITARTGLYKAQVK
jgi:sugar lactone lactonase YvrE